MCTPPPKHPLEHTPVCIMRSCPDDAEIDDDFAVTIESTSFVLPTVRFEWDVSPPPPPPIILSGYQILVDDDPEGFIEVRRKLEDWFPLLKHVATSSIGASVGPYIADFYVTPEQLTRYDLTPYARGPIPVLSGSC